MTTGDFGTTKVTVRDNQGEPAHEGVALASLCAALERTVEAYRPAGFTVREVVVMLENGTPAAVAPEAASALVDAGYGHGI